MPRTQDPTLAIREKALTFPEVDTGQSCNQGSFKAGKSAFLYIGPGAKGVGFKAMFKLDRSRSQAEKLAAKEPDRYEVGSTAWITTRFTAEKPLPKSIWEKWLKESYELAISGAAKGKAKASKKQVLPKATGRKAAKQPSKKKSSSRVRKS